MKHRADRPGLIFLCVMFAVSTATADNFDDAAKIVASAKAPPLPLAWSAPLDGPNVDVMRVLTGGRVLVGAYERVKARGTNNSIPRFRNLSLHDGATGAALWSFDRKALNADRLWVSTADAAVLVTAEGQNGAATLIALDPRDGKRLWQADRSRLLGVAGPVAIVASSGFLGGQSLKGIALADGKELWSASLPKAGRVEIAGDAVYVMGSEITRYRVADGAKGWEATPAGGLHPLAALVRAGAALLVTGAEGISAFDDASGKLLWTLRDGRPAGLAAAGEDVFVLALEGKAHAMVRLDAAGKPLWRAQLGSESRSAVLVDGDLVAVASETHLHCFSRADGRLLWRSLVPGTIALANLEAAWTLELAGGRLVLATADAVAAFDRDTGRRVINAHLPGSELPPGSGLSGGGIVEMRDQIAKAGVRDRSPEAALAEAQVRQAQRTRDFVYSQTAGSRAPDARLGRELANVGVYQARHAALIQTQMDIAFGRMEAATNLAGSIAGAINAYHAAGIRAMVLDNARTAATAREQLADQIVERYAIRTATPLSVARFGSRFRGYEAIVIDLAEGRRADLVLSPWPWLGSGHHARAAYDPATRRFFFAGLGTDPSLLKPVQLAEGRGVAALLMALEADKLPLAGGHASRHAAADPGPDHALDGTSPAGLIMDGDLDGLARYFASPKSQIAGFFGPQALALYSRRGPRLLMFAAYEGNERVVDWLLAHGAQPAQKDDLGWTAADYARWAGHAALAARLDSSVK